MPHRAIIDVSYFRPTVPLVLAVEGAPPISSLPCHRRKARCNRQVSCHQCSWRGKPSFCSYTPRRDRNLNQLQAPKLHGRRGGKTDYSTYSDSPNGVVVTNSSQ